MEDIEQDCNVVNTNSINLEKKISSYLTSTSFSGRLNYGDCLVCGKPVKRTWFNLSGHKRNKCPNETMNKEFWAYTPKPLKPVNELENLDLYLTPLVSGEKTSNCLVCGKLVKRCFRTLCIHKRSRCPNDSRPKEYWTQFEKKLLKSNQQKNSSDLNDSSKKLHNNLAGSYLSGEMLFLSEMNEDFSYLPTNERLRELRNLWKNLSDTERSLYIDMSSCKLSSSFIKRYSQIDFNGNIEMSIKINSDKGELNDKSMSSLMADFHEVADSSECSFLNSFSEGFPRKEQFEQIRRNIAYSIHEMSSTISPHDRFIQSNFNSDDIISANKRILNRKRSLREFFSQTSTSVNCNFSLPNKWLRYSCPTMWKLYGPRFMRTLPVTQPSSSHNNNVTSDAKKKRLRSRNSRYKGVQKIRKNWFASWIRISSKYRRMVIGMYDNEIDAAKAHDAMAREIYGDAAVTNFSLDGKIRHLAKHKSNVAYYSTGKRLRKRKSESKDKKSKKRKTRESSESIRAADEEKYENITVDDNNNNRESEDFIISSDSESSTEELYDI